MKRILITGKNSYIGKSFEKWASQLNKVYQIDSISLRDGKWREYDFTPYNVVIHVAAIVHKKNVREQLYYEINRDLAYEVANTAKKAGVEQFIFFSTMSVFGLDSGVIDSKTKLEPKTVYGKSKLEAEKEIIKLKDRQFLVAVVRPPMIYGPKAVGNYAKLSKLAKKTPIFPKVNNQRSML
ncbi:MAG: NAD-dependent epimerase/dehydratase family protein, partial [Tetragenococcus halophilus]|nr:NAD-dependent epimerase/dehydratase family protein [Tetragenococcus halophilus]